MQSPEGVGYGSRTRRLHRIRHRCHLRNRAGDGVAVGVVNPTEVHTEFGSETDDPLKERFDPGEVTEPEDVAEAIAFAATQRPPNTVSELDRYRRDKFSHFYSSVWNCLYT